MNDAVANSCTKYDKAAGLYELSRRLAVLKGFLCLIRHNCDTGRTACRVSQARQVGTGNGPRSRSVTPKKGLIILVIDTAKDTVPCSSG